jgi:hypothetical protein
MVQDVVNAIPSAAKKSPNATTVFGAGSAAREKDTVQAKLRVPALVHRAELKRRQIQSIVSGKVPQVLRRVRIGCGRQFRHWVASTVQAVGFHRASAVDADSMFPEVRPQDGDRSGKMHSILDFAVKFADPYKTSRNTKFKLKTFRSIGSCADASGSVRSLVISLS